MKESPGFAAKPTLTGEKVVLRPFRGGDLPAIRAVLLDPEARMLTGSVHNAAEARSPEPADGGSAPSSTGTATAMTSLTALTWRSSTR